ncbi:MAG: hypothetical protein IJO98_01960 [Clostridia bacterium]|nr:hypothetical protein [Clostridia bacterium]
MAIHGFAAAHLRRGLQTVGQANRKKKVSPGPASKKSINPLHAAGFGYFWGGMFDFFDTFSVIRRPAMAAGPSALQTVMVISRI